MVQFLEGRNRAWAQLDAPINGSDTNVALVAGQGSRLSDVTTASGRKVRAQIYERDAETGAITKCELVDITNNVSDVLIIERAVESTRATDTTNTYAATPQSFTSDAIIEEVISSDVISEIQDEVNRLEEDKLDKSVYDAERVVYAASSAGDDDYEILTGDSLATVADGRIFAVRADVANNGASTLKVDATSPVALKKLSGGAFADLSTGDIIANQIFFAMKNSAASCYQFSLDPATLSLTVPDADESTKGIAKRASDADAIAKTVTDEFITPHHLSLLTPMYEQTIGIVASTLTSVPQRFKVTSEIDGSAIYIATQSAVSDTLSIRRYARNSVTGKYILSHTAAFTSVGTSNWQNWSLAVVGSYLYVVGVASSNQAKRFAKADLSGATTLTISGAAWGNGDACTTDGTDLLVYDSADNFRRFTISGTTITNAGNVAFTGAGNVNNGSAIYDGTYIHLSASSISGLKKYNPSGGSVLVTNSANSIQSPVYPNQHTERLFMIDTGVLGYALPYTIHTDTAMVGLMALFAPFLKNTY